MDGWMDVQSERHGSFTGKNCLLPLLLPVRCGRFIYLFATLLLPHFISLFTSLLLYFFSFAGWLVGGWSVRRGVSVDMYVCEKAPLTDS